MPATKATAKIVDFSNVKERGNFNTRHIESDEYLAVITKVEDVEAKDGEPMWLFTFQLPDVPRASYPYYCKLVDNQFWKLKQLFEAAGSNIGKRKLKIDPNKIVGKKVGVFMEDDEYEGRLKSVIAEVLPLDQLTGPVTGDVDPEEDDLEEDDIEEEPAPKKRAAKKAAPAKRRRPAPVDEDDEDEDEEDEAVDLDEDEEEEEPPRKRRKPAAAKAPAKRRRRAPVDDDEDDEDLEIDEL